MPDTILIDDKMITYIHRAIIADKFVAIKKLFKIGVDINKCVNKDGLSFLMVAAQYDRIDIMKLLLSRGADLTFTTPDGDNVLMVTISRQAASVIIDEAKKKNCLPMLMSAKNKIGNNFFDIACYDDAASMVEYYVTTSDFEILLYVGRNELLNSLRHASWRSKANIELYDRLCNHVKLKLAKLQLTTMGDLADINILTDAPSDGNISVVCQPLSQSEPIEKYQKLSVVLSQIDTLLNTPAKFLKYFKYFNDELARHCHESYPDLNFDSLKGSYDIKLINGVRYPIPKSTFKNVTGKHGILKSFLVAFLKQYGLANNCYKWIGSIPSELASKIISNGDFFYEDRFDINLFHIDIAHMLQQVAICLAVECGDIELGYKVGEKMYQLSFNDINTAFVTNRTKNSDNMLYWDAMRDIRLFKRISGADPFRLGSLMMCYRDKHDCHLLSDFMIASFCVGFKRLHQAMKEINPNYHADENKFVDHLNDVKINYFMPSPLAQYSILRDKNKNKKFKVCVNDEYAIVEKEYKLPANFKFKKVSL